jgi:hypothetical protein
MHPRRELSSGHEWKSGQMKMRDTRTQAAIAEVKAQ